MAVPAQDFRLGGLPWADVRLLIDDALRDIAKETLVSPPRCEHSAGLIRRRARRLPCALELLCRDLVLWPVVHLQERPLGEPGTELRVMGLPGREPSTPVSRSPA